jgi:transcription antitermination factor NusG
LLQSVRNEIAGVSGFRLENVPKAPSWYAIVTTPRHEKKVASLLDRREVESFLPLYRTVHRWKNGCKAQLELPLFPGYLFVRLNWKNRVKVLDVPGVLTFVGTRSGPAELDDKEIESIRAGLHLQKAEPFADLAIGQTVRIKAGPLAGLNGVLIRNANQVRVVITVQMINQSVAVELDPRHLEAIYKSKLDS